MNTILVALLREAYQRALNDQCHLSPEQEDSLIHLFAHTSINKEQASKLLNMSRAKFDREIKAGRIPKGRKDAGNSQLYWYKDELLNLSKQSRL